VCKGCPNIVFVLTDDQDQLLGGSLPPTAPQGTVIALSSLGLGLGLGLSLGLGLGLGLPEGMVMALSSCNANKQNRSSMRVEVGGDSLPLYSNA
jgi:hypothetical protein